jgi:hypothetical protein
MSLADQGAIIAKRSVSLSKTYPIIGAILGAVSILLARVPELDGGSLPQSQLAIKMAAIGSGRGLQSVAYVSIPLEVFAALIFSTPVLLLYVYDKNNGVLEYFLSLGMDQAAIYKQYLEAALLLSSIVLAFEVVLSVLTGLLLSGTSDVAGIVELPLIGLLIGFPAVSFMTIGMISFSSLQKQRVGSNQPLGVVLGVAVVLPTYITPLVDPSLAPMLDLIVAVIIVILALTLFLLSSRLIKREKLLP